MKSSNTFLDKETELERGESGGDVTGESGFKGLSSAAKFLTKKPSPDLPSFISISVRSPFTDESYINESY